MRFQGLLAMAVAIGLVVLTNVSTADSLAAAKEIADSDPMHKCGARSYHIRPWLLNEGRITVEMTFSNKSVEVI